MDFSHQTKHPTFLNQSFPVSKKCCACLKKILSLQKNVVKQTSIFSKATVITKPPISFSGVIADTSEANQEMGDESKEVTDEERDQSDEKRSEAMRAFSEQQFDEAIALYTEAIKLNPQSALLFAKRGQVRCPAVC